MSLNPEEIVPCPYNKAHVMVLARMQFHLTKCRAQHPNAEKAVCPFNSTHIINKVEMDWHLEFCRSRITGEREFISIESNVEPPLEQSSVHLPSELPAFPSGEVWDVEEAVGGGDSILQKVKAESENKPLLRHKICAPKAEKKQYRIEERRRFVEVLHSNVPPSNKDEEKGVEKKTTANKPLTGGTQTEAGSGGKTVRRAEEPSKQEEATGSADEAKKLPWSGWSANRPPVEESFSQIQISEAAELSRQNNTTSNTVNTAATQKSGNAWTKGSSSGQPTGLPVAAAAGWSGAGPLTSPRNPSNPWAARGPPPSALAGGEPPSALDDFPRLPVSGRGRLMK